ncbi:carboxylesterase family protein [Spongiivirga citrea]|uniref:Phospholipase n=1 Tax=Spongiivirga citrea TaxID=1481457 RepID=A0A6M0CJ13_9FLAO|nr:dienelactone hydrolase family protein [Spongiivirga citrea]NER17905.1 phospholipase [Spongiivirga citrea]
MKKVLSFAAIFLIIGSCFAQDFGVYQRNEFKSDKGILPYRIFFPDNFDATKEYPILFFLHGAGERGNNNESQLVHGASLFIKKEIHTKYPAIVVLPQCPATDYWSNVNVVTDQAGKRDFQFKKEGPPTDALHMVIGLIEQTLKNYPIKKDQVYVGGLSMGGMGTFELVRRIPNTFAAAFAICGGANVETAPKLTNTDWWIFHGAKDQVVPVELSQAMNTALKNAGANVKLTIYPEDGHDSWTSAFAEPDFMDWLFSKRKK